MRERDVNRPGASSGGGSGNGPGGGSEGGPDVAPSGETGFTAVPGGAYGGACGDGPALDARVEALAPMLSDPDPRVRKSAVVALGRMPCDAAVGRLCAALGDRAEGVRALACQALGRLAAPASVPALLGCVHDPSAGVRAGVLWAVANVALHGRIDDEARAALFCPVAVLAFDPDDGVRADAAAVIGSLRDPRSTDALLVLLEDPCMRVRANACSSLGLLDDAKGLAALLGVLEASGKAGETGETGEQPLVLVSALDGVARRAERGSLGLASPQAARALGAVCAHARGGAGGRARGCERPEASASAPAGVVAEGDPAPTAADVRATAVWALGMLGGLAPLDRGAVQGLLEEALRSCDAWTRRYAVEALARIHDDLARETLGAFAREVDRKSVV